MPGPPPKRSGQRRRRNKPAAGEPSTAPTRAAEIPVAGSWAHGVTQWYESLRESGQSAFYTATDWSSAWLMAEAMNAELSAEGTLKAATLNAWLKLNSSLLATEGDRRRAALELQRTEPESDRASPGVTDLRSWREGLSG